MRPARPLVTLFTVLITACFLLPEEEKVLAPPLTRKVEVRYNVVEVERGSIVREAKMLGHLVPLVSYELSFGQRGKLTDLYVADGQWVSQGTVLAELNVGALPNQLEQRKVLLRKAVVQKEMRQLLGANRYELEFADQEVRLKGIDVREIENRLAELRLVAPIAGLAVFVGELEEGEVFEAFTTLMRVVDPKNLVLECERGTEMEFFTVGTRVEIRLRGVVCSGRVTRVAPPPSLSAPRSEEKTLVSVYDLPANAGMGDVAIVSALIERSDDTIVLPKSLVHSYAGRDYVNILNAKGLKEERYVSLGIATSNQVEITEGLEEGELVIVN